MEVQFEDLDKSDLIINCIYKGGKVPNMSSEPFHKLIPGCENSGGFRKKLREDGSGKYAYLILYTSMEEIEWPDYLEERTGVFRYYGDNRTPGKYITDTKKKGNLILENLFSILNENTNLKDMPPIFVFKKTGNGRDVKFLGMAAPGNPHIMPGKDLVPFWREVNGKKFQNYEAYFTLLDTGKTPISRDWIKSLINDFDNSLKNAPAAWKKFIKEGRNGILPLKKSSDFKIPNKYEQLSGSDEEGRRCVDYIRFHYDSYPQGFEECATSIIQLMDSNFKEFSFERTWRDGGRDIIGRYTLNTGGKINNSLSADCALEAICYGIHRGVGAKEMSRLIDRVQYHKFGIMITTGYVDKETYSEVVDKEYPIIIVTGSDIASILGKNSINSLNMEKWLDSVDTDITKKRIASYQMKLKKMMYKCYF